MTGQLQREYRRAATQDRRNAIRQVAEQLKRRLFEDYVTQQKKLGRLSPADLTPGGLQ
jgi:hypothetical protein